MSTAEMLLEYLENNEGEFVSGAKIADALGVSATAVWKAAAKLRASGWGIEAVTNRGYRLVRDIDALSASSILIYYRRLIQEELDQPVSDDRQHSQSANTDAPVLKVEVFESVDSTNNVCLERAARCADEIYVAVSSHQTAGRGRRGRSFYSPSGTGLYMSILLKPQNMDQARSLSLTTIAAVAVSRAIEHVTGKEAGIKWVNDIYMDGLKVCGILTEASFDLETRALDHAVVGIGINVKTPSDGFPEEIRGIAGSICGADETIDRSLLTAEILQNFVYYYRELCVARTDTGTGTAAHNSSYMDEYRKRCIVIGKHVDVLKAGEPAREAVATGLDDQCGLMVRYEDGSEETLSSGEIRIKMSSEHK